MSLVVLGGQGLDELQQCVQELFSLIPSGKRPRPTFFGAGIPYQVRLLPITSPHCDVPILVWICVHSQVGL